MEQLGQAVDRKFMALALGEASEVAGLTGPNPHVGCVLVKGGKVIAKAATGQGGRPHAEASALEAAGKGARGATAYVTLEPCAPFEGKKSPPCCKALVDAGVARVVCAIQDPNPNVGGKGIAYLKGKGVQVGLGVMSKEASVEGEEWAKFSTTKMPFVVLKVAVTLDGKIWSRRESSISSPEFNGLVNGLRKRHPAILVGSSTVIVDNPGLTSRVQGVRDPLRVVFDSGLKTPVGSKVYKDNNALVFTTKKASTQARSALEAKGIRVIVAERDGKVDPGLALKELGRMGIQSVLVEGGSRITQSMLQGGLVDKVVVGVAPKVFGDGVPMVAGDLGRQVRLERVSVSILGDNAVFQGYPAYS